MKPLLTSAGIKPLAVAGVAGGLAVFALFVAAIAISSLIEPGNRVEAFLAMRPPHPHPLRIAATLWMLHLAGGAVLGTGAALFARRSRLQPLQVWCAFATGYLAVFAMLLPGAHVAAGVALSHAGRAIALLVAGALAVSWSSRTHRNRPPA